MEDSQLSPFHLAFPITDIDATRAFYGDVLGCEIGRESPGKWIDFSLFGHQMSAHLRPARHDAADTGEVDGDAVNIPHFGVVLAMTAFEALAQKLESNPDIDWIIRPKVRFQGEPGEQATMFLKDPSGNALEFKGFKDRAGIFAK